MRRNAKKGAIQRDAVLAAIVGVRMVCVFATGKKFEFVGVNEDHCRKQFRGSFRSERGFVINFQTA